MNCTENMHKKIHIFYKNYKMVLVCATVVALSKLINNSEMHILDKIILVSRTESNPPFQDQYSNNACSKPYHYKSESYSSQNSEFYWSIETFQHVYNVRKFAPIFPYVFTGILADRLGGQRLILLSLIISTTVISLQYLVVLKNPNVFLIMVLIRRFGHGIMSIAWVSLAVQWARPNKKCTFIGITVGGLQMGRYFGYLVPKIFHHWKHVCFFLSLLGFTTSLWWWMICCRPEYRYTKTTRNPHIPWRSLLTSNQLYILIMLLISDDNIQFIMYSFVFYLQQVVYFNLTAKFLAYYMLVLVLHLSGLFSSFYFGISSDFLINNRLLTVSATRKLFLGLIVLPITILAILIITQTECNVTAVLVCVMLIHFSGCIQTANIAAIVVDTSPLFACTLYGVTNFFGEAISRAGLKFFLVQPEEPITNVLYWKLIFYITGLSTVLTTLPYLLSEQKEELGGATELFQLTEIRTIQNSSINMTQQTSIR